LKIKLWWLVTLFFLIGCSGLSLVTKKNDWRTQSRPRLSGINNWVTYYGPYYDAAVVKDLNQYDLVVLGWMDQSQLVPTAPIVLQYLAAVEAGPTHRQYYDWLKDLDRSFRLFDNPDYPDAWVIDITLSTWQDLVVEQGIPWTLDHGGQGLMLDTFGDVALYLGNAAKYRQAAIALVKRIRQTYPNLILVVNEPGDLLPDIYQYVDGIIFEQYLADIRTGELFSQPRSTWGNGEIARARQLRRLSGRDFLLLTCDMTENDDQEKSRSCLSRALADSLLPTLTPFSSLGNRYQKLPTNYLNLLAGF